jgi:hypothetical protein
MRPFYLLVMAALLSVSSSVDAGLAPSKGSQLVTVLGNGACPIPFTGSSGLTFSQTVNADGSITPFAIPPKRIFVITDVTLTGAGQPAGDAILLAVFVGSAANGNSIAARYETVASSSAFAATFQFPAGIAVRSGSTVCGVPFNYTHGGGVTAFATAHGFFAPDK